MCSLAGDVMLTEVVNNTKLDFCRKCLIGKPSVILRKTDAYCRECFLTATVHKFRAVLGKYRKIQPNERVLIVYRNGHPCTALLHFIRTGLDLKSHKILKIDPIVVYLDDLRKTSPEKRFEICKNITEEIKSYNFPAFYTSLYNFAENFQKEPSYIELNNNLKLDDMKTIFEQAPTIKANNLSELQDLMEITRRQLIIKMAKILNCKIAFTTEISVDVAVNLLSNISLGRGSHLSLDVGLLDDRDPDVKILQPLRYFDMKELAFYNVFNRLEPVNGANSLEKQSVTASVNKLMANFVQGLQKNYPSTIKTIVRTGDKLTTTDTGIICKICKAPVEIQANLSSSEARNYSHWVSINHLSNRTESEYGNGPEIDLDLCYGCRNIGKYLL